jgi:hypothetical protein
MTLSDTTIYFRDFNTERIHRAKDLRFGELTLSLKVSPAKDRQAIKDLMAPHLKTLEVIYFPESPLVFDAINDLSPSNVTIKEELHLGDMCS